MTTKYVAADGREEIITSALVSFDPDTGIVVLVGTPNGDRQLTQGKAFVMNDFGKTVAVYLPGRKQQRA